MLSKNQTKYLHSLQTKKGRLKEGAFIAEGPKVVGDLSAVVAPLKIFATDNWLSENRVVGGCDVFPVTDDELRKISFLQHPQQVLAVFPLPRLNVSDNSENHSETVPMLPNASDLYLALDGVQDPGNLGTIIRVADWFGINTVFCSNDTVDAYNPKVIQATMGSIARVNVVYTDLCALFDVLPADYPVYGTFLDGENIYEKTLSLNGIIVMGNEGNGISQKLRNKINNKLLIPNFPYGRQTAESLNVAIATAITCSEFRRK